nr:hypothetical protein [Marseillevirus cajuinensis]
MIRKFPFSREDKNIWNKIFLWENLSRNLKQRELGGTFLYFKTPFVLDDKSKHLFSKTTRGYPPQL